MSASPRGRRSRILLVAVALTAWPAASRTAEVPPPNTGVTGSGLHVDWTVDGIVTGAALAGWGALELAKDSLVPATCRWCDAPGIDRDVRSALAWGNTSAANTASSALLASIPAGFLAYDLVSTRNSGGLRTSAEDVLVVTEAVAITGLLTDAAKYAFARQRPYAVGSTVQLAVDSRLSFWSGHASIAFSAAAAGGSVAQRRGYAGWPWVYAVGFGAAATTGYLRIAADQHWLTDVLAGAVVGTAVGFAVPWLHRGEGNGNIQAQVLPLPGGFVITGRL